MNSNNINSLALCIDIAGAVFLFISSEKLMKIIGKMNHAVATRIGRFGDLPIEPQLFQQYWKESKTANWMSKLGIVLMVLGFIGQLVATNMH